jgi:hypothetical protein
MVASRAQSLTPKFLYIPHTSDFPIEIQSRMSPPFFHTLAPIYLARLELSLGSTFSDTSKNCSSVYLGRKSFLNLDCKGLDSLLISLQVANTLAFFYLEFILLLLLAYLDPALQCPTVSSKLNFGGY